MICFLRFPASLLVKSQKLHLYGFWFTCISMCRRSIEALWAIYPQALQVRVRGNFVECNASCFFKRSTRSIVYSHMPHLKRLFGYVNRLCWDIAKTSDNFWSTPMIRFLATKENKRIIKKRESDAKQMVQLVSFLFKIIKTIANILLLVFQLKSHTSCKCVYGKNSKVRVLWEY